jgi:hypothetical protein
MVKLQAVLAFEKTGGCLRAEVAGFHVSISDRVRFGHRVTLGEQGFLNPNGIQSEINCSPLFCALQNLRLAGWLAWGGLEFKCKLASANLQNQVDGGRKKRPKPRRNMPKKLALWMVEPRGFEPLTFSLRTRRSTN